MGALHGAARFLKRRCGIAFAMSMVRIPTLLLLALVLGACGAEREATRGGAAVDPATRLALEAPLLVDPALDTQARRFAVISDPAPVDGSLPLDTFGPATAASARAEARRMAGPPDSTALAEVPCPACSAPTLALRGTALCDAIMAADLAQAARMPAALPIYPRAHLREAGSAQGACSIRAASFTAPANAAEALGFYRSLAAKSGFILRIARSGTMSALLGKRAADGAQFAVIARPLPGMRSEIDLIVSGV